MCDEALRNSLPHSLHTAILSLEGSVKGSLFRFFICKACLFVEIIIFSGKDRVENNAD